jgi:hypothetical protein
MAIQLLAVMLGRTCSFSMTAKRAAGSGDLVTVGKGGNRFTVVHCRRPEMPGASGNPAAHHGKYFRGDAP